MPYYKAIQPGFMNKQLYDPRSKRPVVVSDKVIKPLPAWLEKITQKEAEALMGEAFERQPKPTYSAKEIEIEKDAVTFIDTPSPEQVKQSKKTKTL